MTQRISARVAHTLLVLVLAVGGCVRGGGPGGSLGPRGSLDRITEAELEPIAQLSAFEAVERLRPRWFQTRTRLFPTVHVDGSVRSNGEEILASILCSDIQEMEYLSASDATTRFGTNYFSGAILIKTKK